MPLGFWQDVMGSDFQVPDDRPLADLTTELTVMLGSPDPVLRDEIAYPTLATWLERGVYDDLLVGLGDGMAAGLRAGLGGPEGPEVFRRSFSALALAECVARDNTAGLLTADRVLTWADAVASWYVREQDVRAWVPGSGWAHAVAHGADAIKVLAASRHFGRNELTVLLDVVADRVVGDRVPYAAGEADRLVGATLAVLARGEVPVEVVGPWLRRLGAAARLGGESGDPYPGTHNPEAFLRSLLIHVELAEPAVPGRADVLLALIDVLRESNPYTLGATGR